LEDFAKCSSADKLQELKVFGCECPLGLWTQIMVSDKFENSLKTAGTDLVLLKSDLDAHVAGDDLAVIGSESTEGGTASSTAISETESKARTCTIGRRCGHVRERA
jgi:hypothetical protein